MNKGKLLYSGKAKSVYETDNQNEYIIEHRDDLTALNGLKKGSFDKKGAINNQISAVIFEYLKQNGVETHFIRLLDQNSSLVKKVNIIMLEVIIRNYAAGSFTKRFGIPEGEKLCTTVYEICYKNDEYGDPMINDYHAVALGLANMEQLKELNQKAFQINDLLVQFFDKLDLILVDFKIEFGLDSEGNIILADEITPDTCRLWDKQTKQKLDKDIFRFDLGDYENAYDEILKRVSR